MSSTERSCGYSHPSIATAVLGGGYIGGVLPRDILLLFPFLIPPTWTYLHFPFIRSSSVLTRAALLTWLLACAENYSPRAICLRPFVIPFAEAACLHPALSVVIRSIFRLIRISLHSFVSASSFSLFFSRPVFGRNKNDFQYAKLNNISLSFHLFSPFRFFLFVLISLSLIRVVPSTSTVSISARVLYITKAIWRYVRFFLRTPSGRSSDGMYEKIARYFFPPLLFSANELAR